MHDHHHRTECGTASSSCTESSKPSRSSFFDGSVCLTQNPQSCARKCLTGDICRHQQRSKSSRRTPCIEPQRVITSKCAILTVHWRRAMIPYTSLGIDRSRYLHYMRPGSAIAHLFRRMGVQNGWSADFVACRRPGSWEGLGNGLHSPKSVERS